MADRTYSELAAALGTTADDPRLEQIMRLAQRKGHAPADLVKMANGGDHAPEETPEWLVPASEKTLSSAREEAARVNKEFPGARSTTAQVLRGRAYDREANRHGDKYENVGDFQAGLPQTRRGIWKEDAEDVLLRKFANASTLGLADYVTRKAVPETKIEDGKEVPTGWRDDMRAGEAESEAEHPVAAGVGTMAGYLNPGSVAGAIGRGVAAPLSAATKLVSNPLAKMGVGAAAGALGTSIGAGVTASAEHAADDADRDLPFAEKLARAARAGHGAATNPITLGLGAGAGFLGGMASAIRAGRGQTGRDIRLIEKNGAEVSARKGAIGGAVDELRKEGISMDDLGVGQASKRSASELYDRMNTDMLGKANAEIAAGKKAITASGAAGQRVDLTPIVDEALAVSLAGDATDGTRAAASDLLKRLDEYAVKGKDGSISWSASAEEANKARKMISDTVKSGSKKYGDAQSHMLDGIAQRARDAVDNTDYGRLNAQYSGARESLEESRKMLGLRSKPGQGVNVPEQEKGKLALTLRRAAQDTTTAGAERDALVAFLAKHPEYQELVEQPDLVGAVGRMTLDPLAHKNVGGLPNWLKNAAARNVQPIVGGAIYPNARYIGRNAAPMAQAGSEAITPLWLRFKQMLVGPNDEGKR